MTDGSLPDGWRNTFDGSRILEYSYRSDNIEVNVTPDASPDRSRTRTATDTAYRVELKRNDAGVGGGWELDSGWGDDTEEFDLLRVGSMETARERALEFMERFNRNRQAVEDEEIPTEPVDDADGEEASETDHSGAVFDHDAAAAAVVKDAAAALRAAGEMGADADEPDMPTFDTPSETSQPGDEDRSNDGDQPNSSGESLVDVLHDEVGDAVQVVLHYERGSFETAYHDDAAASEEAFRRLHGELQFLDVGLLEGELPDAGPLSFTMTTFEAVRLIRIVGADTRETLVGIDRDAEVAFPALYERLETALDGDAKSEQGG